MSSLTQKDARTLVNASTLYYIEGKSQQEIAEHAISTVAPVRAVTLELQA